MSTLSNATADINIHRPELWNLVLRLDKGGIQCLLYCKEIDNSLIFRNIKFEKNDKNFLQTLENCIYDNPVLLLDYQHVSIDIETEHFVFAPSMPDATDDDYKDIFSTCYPDNQCDINSTHLTQCDVNIVYGMQRGVMSFLQRTFNSPMIVPHLLPLCEHFMLKCRQSSINKMCLYFHDGRMDMCIFSKGKFTMANSFSFHDVNDALFFILHAWQSFQLDALNDELQLSGDKDIRETLNPMLRKYINFVMPAIFPASAMKIGEDAIKAPFDLILLSICE